MKKLKYNAYILLIAAFALFAGAGCTDSGEGFLDNKGDTQTLLDIFTDSLKTVQFQAAIYWKIPDVIMGPRRGGEGYYLQSFRDYDSASDNMRESDPTNKAEFGPAFTKNDFTQDGINANFAKFLNSWVAMYQDIRVCSQFLENCWMTPMSTEKKERMIAETRFMRAFYYFHLLRNFGGVPLVGDEMLDPFVNHGIPRATFEETVNFIAAEFEYAMSILPDVQDGNDYGRPTKGSAKAVLAYLYFYAASPLYNGGNTGYGANRELVGYPDYDKNRWQIAKDALDEFFRYNEEKGNLYGLLSTDVDSVGVNEDTGETVYQTTHGNYKATTMRVSKERIWYWITFHSYTWPHGQLFPTSRNANPKVFPYHDLTEVFPTKDGVEIRPFIDGEYTTEPGKYNEDNALYNPDDPYANRDPRFYTAFLYNEAKWIKTANGEKLPVHTYRGASQDGIFGTGATSTGYYFIKLCKTNITGSATGAASGHGEAFIRYAELLLMDAEIMTELDYDANKTKIEEHLITIRARVLIEPGINGRYGIPENMDKEQMLDFIMNERRIELVLEGGKRYWDLKRRKLFDKLNEKWSHAAVWEKGGENADGSNIYSWSVQRIDQHYFATRQYHFPIPLKEVEASRGTLIQNPGW